MSARAQLPELIPVERFLRLVAHTGLVRAVVGDSYGILVVKIDVRGGVLCSADRCIDARCDEIVTRRLRGVLPPDGVMSRLDQWTFAILAFGIARERDAVSFAGCVHARVRPPIATPRGEWMPTASIGIAFARPTVAPSAAMRAAERAARLVELNGGDATYVSGTIRARRRLWGQGRSATPAAGSGVLP